MNRIRIKRLTARRGRPWREVVPLDLRDPEVVRVKLGRRSQLRRR